MHVLKYLWRAAWSFFDEGDPEAEAWVHEKALTILAGHATRVAGAIRRKPPTTASSPLGGPTPMPAPST